MSYTQTYRNRKGTLITRVYEDKGKMGRPLGAKGITYNLSKKGRKTKQKVMRALLVKLRAEGRTGWPKGVPQTKEHRAKNSAGLLRAIAEGRFDPRANIMKYVDSERFEPRSNHGTHGKYYSHKNHEYIRYDSEWELIRLKFLEKDKSLKLLERNPFRWVYELDGVEHYYFPDWLLTYHNGDKILEEVKPRRVCELPEAQAKFKVAKIQCASLNLKFRVIKDKKNLKRK
jgi:hypothetical protein